MITKADTGSDHRLVRMTLRIKKRLARRKTIKKKQNPFNIVTQKLKGITEIFESTFTKNNLKKIEEEVTAINFSKVMKEEANDLAGK